MEWSIIWRLLPFLVCLRETLQQPITLDGGKFSSILERIANDGLGVARVQEYYNGLSYNEYPLNGNNLVAEISGSLGGKFNGPIEAVKRLKNKVETEINSFSQTRNTVECCKATGTEYNQRFKSTVNTNEACVVVSRESPTNTVYPSSGVIETMKENYRTNPELKWQYVGTEDGILLNYPSYKFPTCTDYDARFRPFYVSSATPKEKDIVIIIDHSGSMGAYHNGKTLLQIAKEAAISVLQTLNPNDRVGVVAFHTYASVPGSSINACVGKELSEAIPLNIKFFENQIKSLHTAAATNYEAAFKQAFRFFRNSSLSLYGEEREQVILFLTDGKQTAGGDTLATISHLNGEIGNRVMILAYGLGSALDSSALTALRNIVEQTKSDPTKGEIKKGIFQHITNPSKLRSAMSSYYNKFSKSSQTQAVIFSVPYHDLFGLGLITSLCMPVYKNDGSLYGVACSDITMSNLLSDVTYFQQGEYSYAFIIDGRGRTMMHPMLPQPYTITSDPLYINIRQIERELEAANVYESMRSGKSGQKNHLIKRTVSRGDMLLDGISYSTVNATFHWTPIDQSNLSLCIVIGYGDKDTTVQSANPGIEKFRYHRMDLAQNGQKCKHFNRYSSKEYSVVMLTPPAFVNPDNYLSIDETKASVDSYTRFLTGQTTSNPGLRNSILTSVSSTYSAENIWVNNRDASNMVIWRYIGTTDGVMRMYPGIQLPKNYDHTRRPWFKRTMGDRGKYIISAPYFDLWGSGYLITLSKSITEKKKSSSTESTLAIMGTDFTIPYLYQILLNTYGICTYSSYRCFILDDSGFVILHSEFVDVTESDPKVANIHVTYKEQAIAEDLYNLGHLSRKACIDFSAIKEQYSYRLSVPNGGLNRFESRGKYMIVPVPQSNIFIVIRENKYTTSSVRCCFNYAASPDNLICSTSPCDCLCYRASNFDYCKNKYNLSSDSNPTCTPKTPPLETQSISETDKIRNLQKCFDTGCGSKTTKGACHGVTGCSWCTKSKSFQKLSSPYCASHELCYFGIEGYNNSSCPGGVCTTSTPEEGGSSVGGIIGGVIGGLAAVALGYLIVAKLRKGQKPQTDSNNQTRDTQLYTIHNSGQVTIEQGYINQSYPSAPPIDHPPPYHIATQEQHWS